MSRTIPTAARPVALATVGVVVVAGWLWWSLHQPVHYSDLSVVVNFGRMFATGDMTLRGTYLLENLRPVLNPCWLGALAVWTVSASTAYPAEAVIMFLTGSHLALAIVVASWICGEMGSRVVKVLMVGIVLLNPILLESVHHGRVDVLALLIIVLAARAAAAAGTPSKRRMAGPLSGLLVGGASLVWPTAIVGCIIVALWAWRNVVRDRGAEAGASLPFADDLRAWFMIMCCAAAVAALTIATGLIVYKLRMRLTFDELMTVFALERRSGHMLGASALLVRMFVVSDPVSAMAIALALIAGCRRVELALLVVLTVLFVSGSTVSDSRLGFFVPLAWVAIDGLAHATTQTSVRIAGLALVATAFFVQLLISRASMDTNGTLGRGLSREEVVAAIAERRCARVTDYANEFYFEAAARDWSVITGMALEPREAGYDWVFRSVPSREDFLGRLNALNRSCATIIPVSNMWLERSDFLPITAASAGAGGVEAPSRGVGGLVPSGNGGHGYVVVFPDAVAH